MYSDPENPEEVVGGRNLLKRNSKENIWNWKSRLTVVEIKRIRTQVEDISRAYYTKDDW